MTSADSLDGRHGLHRRCARAGASATGGTRSSSSRAAGRVTWDGGRRPRWSAPTPWSTSPASQSPTRDGRPSASSASASSRVDTTARLARAIAAAKRRPRVFVSGSAVGHLRHAPRRRRVRRDDPAGRRRPRARLRRLGSRRRARRRARACASCTRASASCSGQGGALAKMSRPVPLFVGGPVGSGTQWVSWVHVRDVVRALLLFLDRRRPLGPVQPRPRPRRSR